MCVRSRCFPRRWLFGTLVTCLCCRCDVKRCEGSIPWPGSGGRPAQTAVRRWPCLWTCCGFSLLVPFLLPFDRCVWSPQVGGQVKRHLAELGLRPVGAGEARSLLPGSECWKVPRQVFRGLWGSRGEEPPWLTVGLQASCRFGSVSGWILGPCPCGGCGGLRVREAQALLQP